MLATFCCACALSSACEAQQIDLPDAPQAFSTASLHGTITDKAGSLVPGAHIQVLSGERKLEQVADGNGQFRVEGLLAGPYAVQVQADGFSRVDQAGVLARDEQKDLPPISMESAGNVATVTVFATKHEVAAAEIAGEEKQRVLGIIPNFWVVYSPHPTPLSAGQKFQLAWRSTIDPVSLIGTGVIAGIQQANDSFAGYGQGVEGYAKRYGAGFADGAVGSFLGGAILPSLFHQDPRYYYQGTGTTSSRARHAVASVFVCRGDNGKRQFNYSNVLGNFASAGISNLYYPAQDRNGAGLTLSNAAVGTAFGAFAALMQEFVVPKLTPHLPKQDGSLGR